MKFLKDPREFRIYFKPKSLVQKGKKRGTRYGRNRLFLNFLFLSTALKVKLMLRRPREDLVNRGVIPCKLQLFWGEFFFTISILLIPLAIHTPAQFYEQRQRLDMAKKHDILKHKMQRRPLREELVRQHILEGRYLLVNKIFLLMIHSLL